MNSTFNTESIRESQKGMEAGYTRVTYQFFFATLGKLNVNAELRYSILYTILKARLYFMNIMPKIFSMDFQITLHTGVRSWSLA